MITDSLQPIGYEKISLCQQNLLSLYLFNHGNSIFFCRGMSEISTFNMEQWSCILSEKFQQHVSNMLRDAIVCNEYGKEKRTKLSKDFELEQEGDAQNIVIGPAMDVTYTLSVDWCNIDLTIIKNQSATWIKFCHRGKGKKKLSSLLMSPSTWNAFKEVREKITFHLL